MQFASTAMGLRKSGRKRAPHNEVLEAIFSKHANINNNDIREKAAELSMTERQVERWLRIRKMQDWPTKLDKFNETWYV